jgi:hypothetical protein
MVTEHTHAGERGPKNVIMRGVRYSCAIRSFYKKDEIFSDPDLPEQECPEDGHRDSETPDNRTTDKRINL